MTLIDDPARRGRTMRDVPEESLMLTGDEEYRRRRFTVLWRIKPKGVADFLFNIQNPEGTVKAVAESAMREIVGKSNIQPILTGARTANELAVQELSAETLDGYGSGILVQQVQMQKVDPPAQVIDSFSRRAGRARRSRAIAERSPDLCQPRRSRCQGTRCANLAGRRRLQASRRSPRPKGQSARFLKVLRRIQKGARCYAAAHLSGNDGAHSRRFREAGPMTAADRRPGRVSCRIFP